MWAGPLPATINGVALHPLVVHAVVVLLPMSVIGTIGIAVWPAMRRHLGLLVLLVTFLGAVAVPIASSSGEAFRNRLGAAQIVRTHQHYAQLLLPWTAVFGVVVFAMVALDLARRLGPIDAQPVGPPFESDDDHSHGGVVTARRQHAVAPPLTTPLERSLGRVIPDALRAQTAFLRRAQPVLSVLSVALALVVAYYVYKTGDSGAKAVWQGR